MIASEGYDRCLSRTLQEASSSLAGLNVWHGPALGPVLPEVVRLERDAVGGDAQAVQVSGGSLANNNKGGLTAAMLQSMFM